VLPLTHDLVRRLTALVAKIDERDTRLVAMLERHDSRLEHHDAILGELRALQRQQVTINADVRTTLARLETLMTEVFRTRHNGHEA
jgi:chorismate mutase